MDERPQLPLIYGVCIIVPSQRYRDSIQKRQCAGWIGACSCLSLYERRVLGNPGFITLTSVRFPAEHPGGRARGFGDRISYGTVYCGTSRNRNGASLVTAKHAI